MTDVLDMIWRFKHGRPMTSARLEARRASLASLPAAAFSLPDAPVSGIAAAPPSVPGPLYPGRTGAIP